MNETLTGKQVLALLAQDEVPEIEHLYSTGNWYTVDASEELVAFFLNQKNKFRIKQRRLSDTLANGEVVSWPEPVREPLECDSEYWYADRYFRVSLTSWMGEEVDAHRLAFGYVHLTREAAQEHADALRKINTQGVTC